MNPSTAELVAAVAELGAEQAILLPNNSNVRLAAEHAAAHAGRPVEVVGTDSMQAGLAALIAFDGARSAAENAAEMRAAAAAVATGEVTVAVRDTSSNGVPTRRGDWLGLVGGDPVTAGEDFVSVAAHVVERISGGGAGLLTILAGPTWRSSCTTAGSRTTSYCSPRNRVVRVRPVRIVLVEDNAVFREALELLLGMRPEVEVVASVADGSAAVGAAEEHRPDVVLMDYRLPGLDGVQATEAVVSTVPGVAVVALTASANESEREALLRAGAIACLTKDQELDEIIAAICQAAPA
jgi:CheY-like chemotaxis protein